MEDIKVLDPAIKEFFNERKDAWLKKNLKASMSDEERKQTESTCEEVFSMSNWLPAAAKRAGQISISTHPCTFSHPSARKNKNGYVTSVIASTNPSEDGFLRTGNVEVEPDALGNAAALDVYKFLTLVMEDKQKLLDHIEKETSLAQSLLKLDGVDYKELRNGFLKMIESDTNAITSSKIKQVYFPVGENQYHQLSLLTPSSYLFELRKRIDAIRFSESTKKAREHKRNNEFSEEGYREIYGITTIGFGGTKPQNVSVLNNQNAGKAHLLLSTPPELTPRNIRLPKRDFLLETINPWHIKDTFDAFNRILYTEYNNKNIREGRDYRIQEYVDHVIHKMWQLRQFISDYEGALSESLKDYQKIWLYPNYAKERQSDSDWLELLCREISGSFIRSYQKVVKNPIKLGDEEMIALELTVNNNKEAFR